MAERKAKPAAKSTTRVSKASKASTATAVSLAHEGREKSADSRIRFQATLHRPVSEKAVDWTFLALPLEASAKLPSRGMTSVDGTFNGMAFQTTLEPDGQGGHWMKVEAELREASGAKVGDEIMLEIAPVAEEPEPKVPAELQQALAEAAPKARAVWADITAVSRRDWVQWIESAKKEETRLKRIATSCDMLAKGKRRPCCFDRSGMYAKNMSCPVADEMTSDSNRK